MDEVLGSLDEAETALTTRLAVSRYARLALLPGPGWWQESLPHGFREAVAEAVRWDEAVPDARAIARMESLADKVIDLVDETPAGELYYPYQATTFVSSACWGLGEGRGHPKFFGRLWEEALRYAGHVDWRLRESRIPTDNQDPFQTLERTLWLRHARLSGSEDETYRQLAAFSREVAEEYVDAVRCALSEAATADFILILDAADKPRFDRIIGEWTGVRRARFDECIYPGRMADADRTFFESPAFLYLWGVDETEVATLLREAGVSRVHVDVRAQDGSVVEGAAFIADPVKSVTSWQS
ncbi:hypothetical protein [Streptomyces lateritius]|uniref:hypothetical protein n=1 Tax=Streptomyces lateritius TaxID=67313 RepID=UPI001672EEBB|nr:hypothetical protein [Streptomyces lateritius]